MAQIQKKTSTMSLTISSCSRDTSSSSSSSSSSTSVQQRHSSSAQPVCISPQMVQNTNQGSANTGVSPTFVKGLHDVSTVKGQLVVLECRIRGTPPLQISWFRENEQIIDSADFRILRKKASSASVPEELCTLVITEAYPEDSGIFKCTASNQFGTVTCSAMLEVYTDLEEVLGEEDEPSSLSSAGLEPDDQPDDQDDTLIPPPEWPDSSEEETAAPVARSRKNRPGGDGTDASTIQEKCFAPRFIQVPQDLSVEEGRFCRIDFKVVGLPTPDISWYLDGKLIRPDDYHKMLVCEKSVHSFIIEIVTIHHAGVYECVAKNRAGESHFSLDLDVIAQEQLCPPSFVVKMRNSRVLEGDGVRLECKVMASPAAQLYWKKDKEMLRIDPRRMSLSQDASGKQCLVIDPVIKSDAGWYTVSAINEAGMSTCNARLDVATRLNKSAPAVRTLKTLPIFSTLSAEPVPHHTAPLYESEEL
uniref:Myotilin n=1 Tax=Cyprinus carpio TaxID=7962 RepID=A0A8C2IVB7_CYPCA